MPSVANVHARKTARIRASSHTLTLVYPPVLPAAHVSEAPGTPPANPLTGQPSVPTLLPGEAPTPVAPPVTIPCLWYDTLTPPTTAPGQDMRAFGQVGWRDGAHAVAEVLVEDAAVNAAAPFLATKFEGVEHVEHAGRAYRVVEYRPLGASFAPPLSYLVWLVSAAKQEV